MQVPISRLQEKNGFILYRREKTKFKGVAPIPKYYIVGKTYYKDFARLPSANKEFIKLTIHEELPEELTLLVTGTGHRTREGKGIVLLRTDDHTIHLHKDSGLLAHNLVDRYNAYPDMLEALKLAYIDLYATRKNMKGAQPALTAMRNILRELKEPV